MAAPLRRNVEGLAPAFRPPMDRATRAVLDVVATLRASRCPFDCVVATFLARNALSIHLHFFRSAKFDGIEVLKGNDSFDFLNPSIFEVLHPNVIWFFANALEDKKSQ